MTAKTPTALKIVTGNPGKRPLPKNEPKPLAPKSINPPAWLTTEARREWRRVATELERAGLLTELDLGLLAAYSDAHGDMVRAAAALEKLTGDGTETTTNKNVIQHPLVGMKRVARHDMVAFCKEFGMTPVARSGMNVHIGRKPAEESGGKAKQQPNKFYGD